MVELGRDFVAKQPPSASRGDSPGTDIFGVAPNEVAKGAFMGDFLGASDDSDLVERTDLGTQTAVDAENFAVDDGSKNKKVEDLAAALPD